MATKIKNGVHGCSDANGYISPKRKEVLNKLEEIQDRKLGIMMHWSPASQLGIFESWPMVDNEGSWSQVDIDWTNDKEVFRQQYRNLYKTFDPIRFEPKKWASFAKECGFKYLLFTTKHHDGFCMWDTKTTDYKITNEDCPFSKNMNADIVKNLYNAFREEGLGIHTYFSKPDWSSSDYWSDQFDWPEGKTDRNPNYDVEKNPELWEAFVDYTHMQLKELMTDYGQIDCLWLDGGWVKPTNRHQDIRLGEIVEHIRDTSQPGLVCVDRTVGGDYENFITPEQSIPSEPIFAPWESCITLGRKFSFHYEDEFKPARDIVHILIDIVAKGGNLALNIAPQPDGRLPEKGKEVLRSMGAFLKECGDAIYGTRVCAPYRMGNYAFTKKDSTIYVFYLYEENDQVREEFVIPLDAEDITAISMMNDKCGLTYRMIDGHIHLKVQRENESVPPYADVFCIELNA